MKKRNIGIFVLSLSLLTSCGSVEQISSIEKSEETSVIEHDEQTAKLLKNPNIKYNSFNNSKLTSDYRAFCVKLSTFSADLAGKFFQNEEISLDQNISISPLSIYNALALATECANGTTRDEIVNAMNMSYQDIKTHTKTLFEQSCKQFEQAGELVSKELITNSLWFEKTLPLKQNCVDSLADNYYCYSHAVDFKNNANEVIEVVSDFIKKATNNLIDHRGEYDRQTLMVLLNTLYIKDIWLEGGIDLSETPKEIAFTNANKEVVNKKLLNSTYVRGRTVKFDDFSTFYSKTLNGYQLKFMLPRDGKLAKDILTKENIDKVNKLTDYNEKDEEKKLLYFTQCQFPQYESSCDLELSNFFQEKFNIQSLFSAADFSNISDADMVCSSVIHKTKLKVEKKGIEGAAITEMVMKETAIFEGENGYTNVYETLTLDRDFAYIITDSMDVILFEGVVNNIK